MALAQNAETARVLRVARADCALWIYSESLTDNALGDENTPLSTFIHE